MANSSATKVRKASFTRVCFELSLPIFLIGVDQLSKLMANHWHWVTLNQGAAFGWSGISAGVLTLLSLFLLMLIFVFLIYQRLLFHQLIAWQFFFAGAISNLIDRFSIGGVRDWLPIPVVNLQNNLADYFICLGVLLIIRKLLSKTGRDKDQMIDFG